jgi:hypothetical protein
MHRIHAVIEIPSERTAWVLDAVWPETASMVAARLQPGDQLLVPGLLGPRPARYAWPAPAEHRAAIATFLRHLAMRFSAQARGAVRQRTYLTHDRRVARALAPAIDWRARHLVVAQSLLPWLDEAGVLGGRSFDVVMSRYPLAEIHARLDATARALGGSHTIVDFRADTALVAREMRLLERARRIVTPHPDIADLFAERALRLTWHRPTAVPRRPGRRTAFLGPTIARERPDIAARHAAALPEPLIVFGEIHEPAFWGQVRIERRKMDMHWLDDIGTLIHPATMTTQPRRLLEALRADVRVLATRSSGLEAGDYVPPDAWDGANEAIDRTQVTAIP